LCHCSADRPNASPFPSSRSEVLELEERQTELKHAKEQHREHTHDEGELDGCCPIFSTKLVADPHPFTFFVAGPPVSRRSDPRY